MTVLTSSQTEEGLGFVTLWCCFVLLYLQSSVAQHAGAEMWTGSWSSFQCVYELTMGLWLSDETHCFLTVKWVCLLLIAIVIK